MIKKIIKKIENRERISEKEGLFLLKEVDPLLTGYYADRVRYYFHPHKIVTYLVDRNINYTNICETKCRFCAFYRERNEEGAYVLSIEQILKKVKETIDLNGTGILLQGGHNRDIPYSYYIDMLKAIRNNFPQVHIHAFSPPEIMFFSKSYKKSVEDVLVELKDAGLMSLPGGGAEILSDRVRRSISPNKITKREWLYVMKVAHQLGIKSSATMMFGTLEKDEDIVGHLENIRRLQDETNGFFSFIPWTYQKGGKAKIESERVPYIRYLKVLALSRIYLDNIKNIQVSWLTQGLDVASIGLYFGANDIGSVLIEENVVKEAGCTNKTNEKELREVIKSSGFIPQKRNTTFEIFY